MDGSKRPHIISGKRNQNRDLNIEKALKTQQICLGSLPSQHDAVGRDDLHRVLFQKAAPVFGCGLRECVVSAQQFDDETVLKTVFLQGMDCVKNMCALEAGLTLPDFPDRRYGRSGRIPPVGLRSS